MKLCLAYYIQFGAIKVRLWVLLRDQTLTHLSIDISLIPKYILNHNISLVTEIQGYPLVVIVLYYAFRYNSNRTKKSNVRIFHLYFLKWDISFIIPYKLTKLFSG